MKIRLLAVHILFWFVLFSATQVLAANYAMGPNGGRGTRILDWSTIGSLQYREGQASLVATDATDGATVSLRLAHDPADSLGQAAVNVSIGSAAAFTGVGIWVKNTTGGTRGFELRLWNAAGSHYIAANMACDPSPDWQYMVVPYQQLVVAGWSWSSDAVAYVRVTETALEDSWPAWQNGESLLFGPVYYNPTTRPKFVICTDDGYAGNLYDGDGSGYPASGRSYKAILDHYGFKGTAFIVPTLIGSSDWYMTWDDVATLQQAGWTIGSHSNTHPQDGDGHGLMLLGPYGASVGYPGAVSDDSAIYNDIVTGARALEAHGFASASKYLALPQGGWDPYVESAVKRAGFKYVRGISQYNNGQSSLNARFSGGNNLGSTYIPTGWITITGSVQSDGAPTVANMKAFIDECIRTGSVCTNYTHGMNGDVATKFDALVSYLSLKQSAGLIDVVTLEELERGASDTATFTIQASAGPNGTISPSGAISVAQGASQTFAITPDSGYAVESVTVDGTSVGAVTSYTFSGVAANHSISAAFKASAPSFFTISAAAGPNGSISPSGTVTVTPGASQTFAITPAQGYHVEDVLVDGASVGAVASYTFENVAADHAISATFAATQFSIAASAGTGGSISPSGTVSVNQGASQTFTITPAQGYRVLDVQVDGASVGAVTAYTFANVTTSHAITASFASAGGATYTITASSGSNGKISPSGKVTVSQGGSQTFTITPNAGYGVANVTVDGVSVGAVPTYTFSGVTANHTIRATFALVKYTITASAGSGGTISPSGTITVNSGATKTFSITPRSGYRVLDVQVDGASVGAVRSYTFANVTANHAITASFTRSRYTITASAGTGGTISPSGAVPVDGGASQVFAIMPASGYTVAGVTVDGRSMGAVIRYSFSNVQANHAISATFRRTSAAAPLASAAAVNAVSPAASSEDLVGSWTDSGVSYLNASTGQWINLTPDPASMLATGDFDGDGIDDIVCVFPGKQGIFVRYSTTGQWSQLAASTPSSIAVADMTENGRADLVAAWADSGVQVRSTVTGQWTRLSETPALMIAVGDLGDGTRSVVGVLRDKPGLWLLGAATGQWAQLAAATPDRIAMGDMTGNQVDNVIGVWAGSGVLYRDSVTGKWVQLSSTPASLLGAGDLDGDGVDDLYGVWPDRSGIWAYLSATGQWQSFGNPPICMTTGRMHK